jgi:hypothetical protein
LQDRQGRDGLAAARMPTADVDVDALADVLGAPAVGRRDGGEEFDQGRFRGAAETEVGEEARRIAEEEGADLGFGQTGGVGAEAVGKRPTAAGAALGVDGDAGAAEGVHVAVDRPLRDLEAGGEFARGQAAMDLEQEQDREQAIGAHRRPPAKDSSGSRQVGRSVRYTVVGSWREGSITPHREGGSAWHDILGWPRPTPVFASACWRRGRAV